MNPTLYNTVIILIPSITIAGQALTNVYGRIKSIYYDTEFSSGVIGLRVGESLTSEITYLYEVATVISANGTISSTDIVQIVLDEIPNSSIYSPA